MSSHCEMWNFKEKTVLEINKFLVERGVSVNGYHKPSLIEIASSVQKMQLPVIYSMKNQPSDENSELIIHEMEIEDTLRRLRYTTSSFTWFIILPRTTNRALLPTSLSTIIGCSKLGMWNPCWRKHWRMKVFTFLGRKFDQHWKEKLKMTSTTMTCGSL